MTTNVRITVLSDTGIQQIVIKIPELIAADPLLTDAYVKGTGDGLTKALRVLDPTSNWTVEKPEYGL